LGRSREEGGVVPREGARRRSGKLSAVLLYSHKYPPDAERRIREEARNTGEALPAEIVNAPILRLGSALYLNAWFELDVERDRSKLEPVKRSSCFDYASDYDFDFDQTEDLWFYIQRMDREFLKFWKTKLPRSPQGGRGARGGKVRQRGDAE
jgi:hypothetical protein